MVKRTSEFGKGLIICLVKFAEHFENSMARQLGHFDMFMKLSKEKQDLVRSNTPPDNLNYGSDVNSQFDWWMKTAVPIWGTPQKTLSHEIELWLNCASDHLYEIEVPKGKSWDKIRAKVKKLQNKGLEMGHGFQHNKSWKIEDVNELKDLTEQISLMVDKKIGLKSDIGKW